MRVHPYDGRCRSCGGELEIIDADDATLTVFCADCGESYPIETDGLGDGGMHYWPLFLASLMERREDE